MKIEKLREEIRKQREVNIELYKSIPLASHEDPCNKKAEFALKKWREGSVRLKTMLKELRELEMSEKNLLPTTGIDTKTFINGFGEATTRGITCTGYEREQRKISKEILAYIS